jgi:C1A family cysteine protease
LLILLISLTSLAIPVYANSSSVQSAKTSGISTRGISVLNSLSAMQNANDTGEALGLGWLPEDVPADSRVTPVYAAALPTHFDWSNWMTSVKNQGGCGSCVAFGAVGATEAQYRIAYNNPTWGLDLSEQHLFSCGGGQCGYGWYISAALNRLRDYGTPDEACFPYQAQDRSCSGGCSDWQSRASKISSWSWVANNAGAIEAALMNGPLVAGFTVYRDFYGYHGGVYHWDRVSQSVGGHAIVIVGYDSNEQYWIVKNSWGSYWGESGYFRIGFGEAGIENYVASIHPSLPAPLTYTVSFYTDPMSGNITADGALKSSGATGAYQSGARVHVVANPPPGYSFLYWETSGVSVDITSAADIYMTVSSGGQLKAYFTVGFALNGLTPDNLALAASSSRVLLAARGMENGIWYRSMDSSATWSSWDALPGFTDVRPAVAVFNGRLYFVCKQAASNNIWYGYYPLTDGAVSGSFSGWTWLPGPTPAALSVATDGSYLYVAAVAPDGTIWHRRMDTSGTWSAWVMVPGFTDVSPAITVFQNRLYFVCKQKASNNIWYGYVDLGSYPSGWSGWTFLPGPTPDALTLTASSDSLYVAARGMENGIWYRSMDASGTWTGWSRLAGFTDVAPAIAIFNGKLYFVCKEAGSNNIWYRSIFA